MSYKIYKTGAFVIVEDSKSNLTHEFNSQTVQIEKLRTAVTSYDFLVNGQPVFTSMFLTEITDGAGVAYTSNSFDTFRFNEVGRQNIDGIGTQGPVGPAGLVWESAWVSGTSYAITDAVSYNGSSYVCVLATAGTTTPDVDTTHWNILASKGSQGTAGIPGPVGPAGLNWQGAWASGTSYVADDAVGYSGASYFCINATSGTTTPNLDTANWALLASQGAIGPVGPQGPIGPAGSNTLTLADVLTNGHDLSTLNYNNFQGTTAGGNNYGIESIGLGTQASYNNGTTTPSYSVALGFFALSSNTTANSVGIGNSAGMSNSGNEVIAIGNLAARTNSGNNVVGIGYEAARTNTGDNAVGIGYQSAKGNTANDLVSIGYQSGQNNTGSRTVSIGHGTGYGNTAFALTALGRSSGQSNTGDNTVGIGSFAAFLNTGTESIGIGFEAARQNAGLNLVGVGGKAGYLNTGDNLVAIGYQAGMNNGGIGTVAIGSDALGNNTGTFSIGIGFEAGYNNTGNNVIALGYQSGTSNFLNGVTMISNSCIPQFANHTLAVAFFASGAPANTYLYYNSTTNAISAVRT